MKHLKVFIAFVISMVSTCLAYCGNYQWPPAPSVPGGGGISGGGVNTPFTLNPSTGYVEATGGGYPASTYGSIQYTFVWNGSEPPPKSVIITSWGSLESQGYPVTSATASNGLGSAPVAILTNPYFGGQRSEGYKYEVRSNPGSSFTVSITPSASGMSISGKYSVSVTPVTVSVGGTLLKNGYLEALIGQYLSPSLSAGYQISNIQWAVPGNAYGSVSWTSNYTTPSGTTDGHLYNPLPSSALTQSTFSFFHLDPQSDLISASATVTFPDNTTATVNGERGVEVMHPDFSLSTGGSGTSQYLGPSSGIISLFSGDNSSLSTVGMKFNYYVLETPDFVGQGTEYFSTSQLVKMNRDVYRRGSSYKDVDVHNSAFVLDTCTFYSSTYAAITNTSTGTKVESDTPGQEAYYGTATESFADDRIVVGDDFKMFLVYFPPQIYSGYCEWVPLKVQNWTWHSSGAESSPGVWASPIGNPAAQGSSEYPGTQWQWSDYQATWHDAN